MGYRLANAAWCLLLLYAAAVQLNDPDPLQWLVVYATGAAFCAVAAIRGSVPIRPTVAWALCGAAIAAGNAALGSGEARMGLGGSEIARETLGLTLMSGWLVALALWTRRRARAGLQP